MLGVAVVIPEVGVAVPEAVAEAAREDFCGTVMDAVREAAAAAPWESGDGALPGEIM